MVFFCVTDKGEKFSICYLSDKTPWNDVKECFPVLKECYFNGPSSDEPKNLDEIVIYPDEKDMQNGTRVAPGWKHVYMGYGNHLVIREDHYPAYSDYLKDLDECEIYGKWSELVLEYIRELGNRF